MARPHLPPKIEYVWKLAQEGAETPPAFFATFWAASEAVGLRLERSVSARDWEAVRKIVDARDSAPEQWRLGEMLLTKVAVTVTPEGIAFAFNQHRV